MVVLSGLLLLTGCAPFVENNLIEELSPVIFWSLEDAGEGKLTISTLVPPLIRERKRILRLQVNLIKQGGKGFNLLYYRELKAGQLRILLIHENLAKKGINSLLNNLFTAPDISHRLYLVIVKGSFDDYINSQLLKQEKLDYFLYRMLKHYEKKNQGELTIVNLHHFMKKLYSPYSYPTLPVFKVNNENFTYEGTAFFKHDKLIANVKQADDQIIQLIGNNRYLKFLPIPELSVAVGHIRSKVNTRINEDHSSMYMHVDLNGRIEEYRGNENILEPGQLAELNQEIKSYLEKQTTALLQKMQRWKVDPLQLGNVTRTPFSKGVPEQEWMDQWEKMKISVTYDLHLQPLTNVNP